MSSWSKVTSAPPNLHPTAPAPPRFHQPFQVEASSIPSASNPKHSKRPVADRGNYVNYYKKRRTNESAPDPRLALVPKEWIRGSKCLDVGCNSGLISIEVAQSNMGASKVVGVDIDKTLIEAARSQVSLAWSRQEPVPNIINEAALLEGGGMRDRPPHEQHQDSLPPSPAPNPTYFPIAFPRIYGYLPLPPRKLLLVPQELSEGDTSQGTKRKRAPKEVALFPSNLSFEVADWPVEPIPSDYEKYDLILAFSITKWIHLHTFNSGLLTFFKRCFDCLNPGGRLILEAQPYSTYSNSARSIPLLKSNLEKLRNGAGEEKVWKAEEGDFTKVLLQTVGFEKMDPLGSGSEQGFQRPLDVYTKAA